ncbi:MAG: pyruvate kinase [Herpetosiphonaceae bacterium]|nr:pyruvate kinase [Herpetosiphonaceae bacterium]
MRRTKIVATLGPATNTEEKIIQLAEAGMNVARLNFSHGTHADHAERVRLLRQVSIKLNRPIAVLQDLQGPKIRTGKLVDHQPIQLKNGEEFIITKIEMVGVPGKVSTTYTNLPHDCKPGDRVLLSDGLIELKVKECTDSDVITEVVTGGTLRENQGINLPGVDVSAPAMTEKDHADLIFGLHEGVDYVAISFVRRAADVELVKQAIAAAGYKTPVIAKIEKPEAVANIDAIVAVSDGIMVARGDLGVELPPEQVPLIQKRIISAANREGVPVITATQMLESMIVNPRPTRAEASDVANAILDGTDAVMLSGETASGAYPIEAVAMMARIAEVTERGQARKAASEIMADRAPETYSHAISHAACAIAESINITAIVAFTSSGYTARLVAKDRPKVPIVAMTHEYDVYHRLALLWGVEPLLCPFVSRLDDLSNLARSIMIERAIIKVGDSVVITGGHPLAVRGTTNFLKILAI